MFEVATVAAVADPSAGINGTAPFNKIAIDNLEQDCSIRDPRLGFFTLLLGAAPKLDEHADLLVPTLVHAAIASMEANIGRDKFSKLCDEVADQGSCKQSLH